MGLKNFLCELLGIGVDARRGREPSDSVDRMRLASLLKADEKVLRKVLKNPSRYYERFQMRKRRGGCRIISAPQPPLIDMQRRIYMLLGKVQVHPAAMAFRAGHSVADNAEVHLGQSNILKVDIRSFFGSIQIDKVTPVFIKLGYNRTMAEQLAGLCCLNGRLPQGAPTSPILSNAVVYQMDVELSHLARTYGLSYSRYADDMVFSGSFLKDQIYPQVQAIIKSHGFTLNAKKTQYLEEKQRKIITGVSISSGKLTIPKARKRALRQQVHYLLTRGVDAHKAHIQSKDPLYVQRVIGHLCFWHLVEPDNEYVIKSIQALKALG